MKKLFFFLFLFTINSFAQFSTKWDTLYTGVYFSDILKLNNNTLIAATNEGILVSNDMGNNWSQRSNQVLYGLIKDNLGRIWGFNNTNIFVSDDGGFSWAMNNFILGQGYFSKMSIDGFYNLWIYANNPARLYRSANLGMNWSLSYSSNYEIADIDFDGLNNVYLIADGNCMRSTDGGSQWTIFFEPPLLSTTVQMDINTNDEIYLAGYQQIFHTTNYGINWRTLNGIRCQSIKAIDEASTLFVGDGIYISSDRGNYWYYLGLNINDPFSTNIYIIDTTIFAAYQNVLTKYNHNFEPPVNIVKENYLPLSLGNKWLYWGINWFFPFRYHFLRNSEATNEQIIGNRRYFFVSNLGWMSYSNEEKIYYHYQNNQEFAFMDFKLPENTYFPVKNPQNPDNIGYHKTQSGNIYHTNIHTKGYNFPYSEGTVSHWFVDNLGYYSYSDDGLYGSYGYHLIQALIKDSTGTLQLYDYPYNPQIIFTPITKTKDTLLTFTVNVDHYFSADTSSYVLQGLNFIDTVFISGFYSSPEDTLLFNNVYAENVTGTKNFIFNVPINLNLLNTNYKLNYRITANDRGLVPHFDFKPSDSTYFQMELDSTVSVENLILQTFTYQLSQNYPNPFNPATFIEYQIPKTGLVTIKVYDVLGKEISTLVNENKSLGMYSVLFDGSLFASGVYIYRITSGDFVSSKKMVLIK